jgi:hypothetical protein
MSIHSFYSDVRTIYDVIKIGTKLDNYWFRGHTKDFGTLVPGAYRLENLGMLYSSYEHRITEEFQRQAPALSSYIPEELNYLEWLFIMQHYGCPTRLLDWSQNVLVAIYFAVKEHFNWDAELWCIDPFRLNEESIRKPFVAGTNNDSVIALASDAFKRTDEIRKKNKLKTDMIDGPISLFPPMRFPRMINQSSVFTIHPFPDSDHESNLKSIEALLVMPFICRYRIPKSRKKPLLKELNSIGINEHNLFPDLDALSKSIRTQIERDKLGNYEELEPHKFD